jgi:hypothetical protein
MDYQDGGQEGADEGQNNGENVGAFWVPDADCWSAQDIARGFHIRRFVKEDSKKSWWESFKPWWSIVASVVMVAIGCVMIYNDHNDHNDDAPFQSTSMESSSSLSEYLSQCEVKFPWDYAYGQCTPSPWDYAYGQCTPSPSDVKFNIWNVLKSVFFSWGLIPGLQFLSLVVIPTTLDILVGKRSAMDTFAEMPRGRPFWSNPFWKGVFYIVFCFFLVSISIRLNHNPEDSWWPCSLESGEALVDAGGISLVTGLLYFIPDLEDEVKELKESVNQLDSSMARGLADGYFWNFVKLVAEHVERERLEPFLIIVPRTMEEWNVDLIKDYIDSKFDAGEFDSEQLIPDFSRPINVIKVIQSDILIDIPTTITSIIRRVTDEYPDVYNRNEALKVEVNIFTYRIAWLLKRNNYENYVDVVEVDERLLERRDR